MKHLVFVVMNEVYIINDRGGGEVSVAKSKALPGILMASGVSHLVSTLQTPPLIRVRELPLIKKPPYISIHNL